MKVKRVTLTIEVPVRTVTSRELASVVKNYLDSQGIPNDMRIRFEMSPNDRIGDVTDYESNRVMVGGRYVEHMRNVTSLE